MFLNELRFTQISLLISGDFFLLWRLFFTLATFFILAIFFYLGDFF
jgi:hypothetical protein